MWNRIKRMDWDYVALMGLMYSGLIFCAGFSIFLVYQVYMVAPGLVITLGVTFGACTIPAIISEYRNTK